MHTYIYIYIIHIYTYLRKTHIHIHTYIHPSTLLYMIFIQKKKRDIITHAHFCSLSMSQRIDHEKILAPSEQALLQVRRGETAGEGMEVVLRDEA